MLQAVKVVYDWDSGAYADYGVNVGKAAVYSGIGSMKSQTPISIQKQFTRTKSSARRIVVLVIWKPTGRSNGKWTSSPRNWEWILMNFDERTC